MTDAGKGSTPRPIQDREAFERNWERIFGGNVYSRAFDETEADFRERVKADLDSRTENEEGDDEQDDGRLRSERRATEALPND